MDKLLTTTLPREEAPILEMALAELRGYGLEAETIAQKPQAADRFDALVQIAYAGHGATFTAEVKRAIRPATLGVATYNVKAKGDVGLLVADYITPPMADRLRAERVQFIDAAGNAYLERPPLFVWVKGNRPKERVFLDKATGRAFQATGLQVLFALICYPEWVDLPYRELARRGGVAHGTVGWVMAELATLGFVATVNGKRRLLQRERLLHQWTEQYARRLRHRLIINRYQAETLDWWSTIDLTKYKVVLGGEPAAARMTGHLQPATITFYASKLDPRLVFDLRLRPDPAGNVDVLKKFWTFEGEEPGLAPAPLVYADLMATGEGRCMETAKMIYDQLFKTGA